MIDTTEFTEKVMRKLFGYECFGKSSLCYLHREESGIVVPCKVVKACHKEFFRLKRRREREWRRTLNIERK